MVLVVVRFVVLLGLFQMVTYLGEELISLCQLLCNGRDVSSARVVGANGGQVTAKHHPERSGM
jgi:hypothetical protein